MHLLCALGWHRPSSMTVRNEGRHFGRCSRCKADLIQVGRGWNLAPRGYRVVWKEQVRQTAPASAPPPEPVPEAVELTPEPAPELASGSSPEASAEPLSEPAFEALAQAAAPPTADPVVTEVSPARPRVPRSRPDRRVATTAELPTYPAGKQKRRLKEGRRKKSDLPSA